MDVNTLLTPQNELKQMLNCVQDGGSVSCFGIKGYGKCIAAAFLKRFVYVCADVSSARGCCEELSSLGLTVAYAPPKGDTLNCAVNRSNENDFLRLGALSAFALKRADALVVTGAALTELYPRRSDLTRGAIYINCGEEYNITDICARLVEIGYERREQVASCGEFAVRGDILDVWSVGDACGTRIEFFGDTVDSVRSFDSAYQTADKHVQRAVITAATDIFVSREREYDIIRHTVRSDATPRLLTVAADTQAAFCEGSRSVRFSYLLPLCPHQSFAEFFGGDTLVYDDVKAVADNIAVLKSEHAARYGGLNKSGDTFAFTRDGITDASADTGAGRLAYHRIDSANRLFAPEKLFNFTSAEIADYSRDIPALAADIEMWTKRGYSVTVACGNSGALTRLRDAFIELKNGMSARLIDDFIPHGATFFESNSIIVGSLQISRRAAAKVIKRTGRDAFVLPEVGDYVVHRIHGIGLCENITRLNLSGSERDYVVVLYEGGDRLYLPIENIDSLSKLIASEHPKLSKIGGADFARLCDKVKRSVKDMALGLAELYAKRSEAKGCVYSPDDTLLDEFCADFPYAETEDQLTAVYEGLQDLKSGKIMDRLLCGDVGFGKTEVAMRLAFKVICEGKQVAFISPTTILARQHFQTVTQRMSKFGVNAVSLNRMNTKSEIEKAIADLKSGKADIVCGTHRVLSADVDFKDLGLLILDEEQRFGVADKEKIKKLKLNVNVLSLSATPIPRTLHLSMTGIRDISVLDTPPSDRLPVQTFVTEYSETLVADAINREVGRGGQVFIVYNRVADIDSFAAAVQRISPQVKICVAHGQMDEARLTRAVTDFSEGRADVLVASTIIENGIDMPMANTMIVVDSDRLGLSQMYQLRGRVGRSNRLAYVYFTYDSAKILSESAYKRLSAITEYTELSSGFKIAMRDLEIRGAGSILGKEQHGHIEKIGYDAYCKILQAAVDELRGKQAEREKNDVTVTCDFNAFIPESYVTDKHWRVRLYSRIAKISSQDELASLIKDAEDVYGAVPKPTRNLMYIGLIKNLASGAGASGVNLRGESATAVFGALKQLPESVTEYISSGRGVSFGEKDVRIKFTGADSHAELIKFLSDCNKK